MFQKMRNRILLVNMTIITALLAILLSVIYLTTYNRILADNQAELDHISRWDFFASPTAAIEAVRTGFTFSDDTHATRYLLPVQPSSLGIYSVPAVRPRSNAFTGRTLPASAARQFYQTATLSGSPMIRMAPTDLSHSFHVIVDNDGEVLRINSYTGLSEEDCSQAAETVWSLGAESGTLRTGGHTLMYSVQPLNPRTLVFDLVYNQDSGILVAQLAPTNHRITFLDITTSRNTLNQLLTTELIAAAVGLVFIFAISYFFANRSIAPIAQSWDRQKQFVADASHELKTPLAVISANSDALLANPGETVDSQRIWVEYIKAETARMSRLVGSLLTLAQTESPAVTEQTRFDLSELATDAVLTMESVAFEKGLPLTASLAPGLHLTACREDILRALLILLDNAVKYTEPGGAIAVSLTQEKRHALFTVRNSGAGLSDDVLSKMFDRFFRADPSRNQESGSFGLGLSIAKNIVTQAGGTIWADSAPGEGVTVTIRLPSTE